MKDTDVIFGYMEIVALPSIQENLKKACLIKHVSFLKFVLLF